MDVDVAGGVNVKKLYGAQALSIFIMPPSIEELRHRLLSRATDSEEEIQRRVDKAAYEISFADKYDKVVINDDLNTAVAQVKALISEFIHQ